MLFLPFFGPNIDELHLHKIGKSAGRSPLSRSKNTQERESYENLNRLELFRELTFNFISRNIFKITICVLTNFSVHISSVSKLRDTISRGFLSGSVYIINLCRVEFDCRILTSFFPGFVYIYKVKCLILTIFLDLFTTFSIFDVKPLI